MFFFFFFNDTATTEIYTLSLHDALPISATSPAVPGTRRPGARADDRLRGRGRRLRLLRPRGPGGRPHRRRRGDRPRDRKSTRLNSSHANISYAVFCLKKKKIITMHYYPI